MRKLLIALLALDIGVSLSKVFIFTWKPNYLAKKEGFAFLKKIFSRNSLFDVYFIK